MLRVSDLKLSETSSWSLAVSSFEDWFVISDMDTTCNSCNSKLLIIVQELTTEIEGGCKFLCVGCCIVVELASLNMKHQHVFVDRIRLMKEVGLDLVASSFADLLRLLSGYVMPTKVVGKKGFTEESNEIEPVNVVNEQLRKGEDDAPIPKGYRSVAWIRPYEAHAIKFCHENKKDHTIKNSDGQVVLECKYFPNDSYEVKKFKSNVQAIRVNGENRRVIGWIRNEEARAILVSEKERRDIEFSHVRAGKGGLVQFFAENLEVARKYRSTTRLLRLD
jgi:hypothetical protein